ncbi:ABC transporter permease [Sinanaerobacter sp. ZZT-01]|uniref:ABC transporter permease n=1 Tax=Sinanaerobacter sp. ZZT-01 TaxID=3111540 RepID=UPI002D771E76|nr:ABC transporter permease [Sinanaerobacter sp. ZZT-01]WRR94455.1 ABC transporter permease [Sinanaerobacter sp. ZZT-01]
MKIKATASPYLLWMILFIIIPLGLVAYFSVTDRSGHFSLDNYKDAFAYAPVIFNSIWLAIIATVVCLILAYPLAYTFSRSRPSHQRTLILLIMLPMWMNFLLRTYAWMTLLENNGLINRFFGFFGLGPFEMINTSGAVVLGMVYNYLPFMILPLYSVMTKIDYSLIEAAQDLGCNSIQILKNVIIPLSMPGITTGVTMVFVPSVSTFVISRMLGGGSNMLIGDLIEMQFLGNAYNPNLGSALSMVLMVIILICMALTNMFSDVEEKEGMLI